jgi:hypothetical protein
MHGPERISLRQAAQAGAGYTTTLTFPPAPVAPNQNAAFEQTIINRGAKGFKLTVVMVNPGTGSLSPIVNECTDSPNIPNSAATPQSNAPTYGKIWQKSAPITVGGTFTMTVYPALSAATGSNDIFNDVLGYKFNVVLQHNNSNPMTYDAYLDLIP